MMDIINPWGALRRAKAKIAKLEADIECANNRFENNRVWELMLGRRVKELEALIAEGHFRNPKTGRLGRKGEVFDV
jgi:hypothetical protein